MTYILLSLVSVLVISNITTAILLRMYYRMYLDSSKNITRCRKEQRYLDEIMINLKSENEALSKANSAINAENKQLKSKLDKINNQISQIRKHFKTN